MKKIEIRIIEKNLTDDMAETVEFKCVESSHIFDECITPLDDILDTLLEKKWPEVKKCFLNERKYVPFIPCEKPPVGYIPSSILAIAELEKVKKLNEKLVFGNQAIEDFINERIKELKETKSWQNK